jgi:hypothetical protein
MKQDVKCPICENTGNYSNQYEAEKTIFDKQSIFTCPNCFLSWNNNISQAELNEYYYKDYNSNDFKRSELFKPPEKYFSNENKMFKLDRSKSHLKIASQLIAKKMI